MVAEKVFKLGVTALNRSGIVLNIKDANSNNELIVEHGKEKNHEFHTIDEGELKLLKLNITALNRNSIEEKSSNKGHLIMEFILKNSEDSQSCDTPRIKYLYCDEEENISLKKRDWGVLIIEIKKQSSRYEIPTNVEVGIDDPGRPD